MSIDFSKVLPKFIYVYYTVKRGENQQKNIVQFFVNLFSYAKKPEAFILCRRLIYFAL